MYVYCLFLHAWICTLIIFLLIFVGYGLFTKAGSLETRFGSYNKVQGVKQLAQILEEN